MPISFSSLSEGTSKYPAVASIASARKITAAQVMYAYLSNRNISVLSSYDPSHPDWVKEDLAIFGIRLSESEMKQLDAITIAEGKRTCTDCFTEECEACAAKLGELGCPLGQKMPVWGRDNQNATQCMACAALPAHKVAVQEACGETSGGESLETMVPKACGA